MNNLAGLASLIVSVAALLAAIGVLVVAVEVVRLTRRIQALADLWLAGARTEQQGFSPHAEEEEKTCQQKEEQR